MSTIEEVTAAYNAASAACDALQAQITVYNQIPLDQQKMQTEMAKIQADLVTSRIDLTFARNERNLAMCRKIHTSIETYRQRVKYILSLHGR